MNASTELFAHVLAGITVMLFLLRIGDGLEKVTFVVRYFKLVEKDLVFLLKRPARVVLFLILDVTDHRRQLRMRIREPAKAFLPVETSGNPPIAIDEIRRSSLDVTNEIRKRDIWLLADQNMSVVRHAMDGQQLLPLSRHDAGHVFLKFFLPFTANQVLPSFDREDNLNVDLGVGVRHLIVSYQVAVTNVEAAFVGVFDREQQDVVGPAQGEKDFRDTVSEI